MPTVPFHAPGITYNGLHSTVNPTGGAAVTNLTKRLSACAALVRLSLVVAEKSGYTPPIRFVLIVTYTGSSYSLQTSWMAYRSL